jgi:hypothetical protein
MPVAAFADVSGHVYSSEFPADAQIRNALDFLATTLATDARHIRILCFTPDSTVRFYPSDTPLFPAASPHFLFQVVIVPPPAVGNAPPRSILEAVQRSDRQTDDYAEYYRAVLSVPPDVENMLQRIIEMGFDRSDAEEALRHSHYDTTEAIASLTHRQEGEYDFRDFMARYGLGLRPTSRDRDRASPSPPIPAPRPWTPPREDAGPRRMTPEQRQVFNRIRRRQEVTEESFMELLQAFGGDLEQLNGAFAG